jgi:FkbM family methyltransferase
MRPTARARNNPVLRTAAKLSRQYLRWFGNASHKPHKNGERWLLDVLGGEKILTVLDVGANVGKWSLLAVDRFPQARILALEIVPPTAAVLRERTAGQERIRAFNLGLADHTGTLTIRYNPAVSAHSTVTDFPYSWEGEKLECSVMRGDEFLAREGVDHVDFLKIDVEGAEHMVLKGLEALLRRGGARFVQFEYGRMNILTRFLLKDFYELFASHGYVVGKIFPDYVEIRAYNLVDEDFLGANYLACRTGDPLLARLTGTA